MLKRDYILQATISMIGENKQHDIGEFLLKVEQAKEYADILDEKGFFKKRGGSGKARDQTIEENLHKYIKIWNNSVVRKAGFKQLPKTTKITDQLYDAFALRSKEFTLEEMITGLQKYLEDCVSRPEDNGYKNHRFTLFKFLKQSNGLQEFFNT